jgi:hypothetical protein
MNQPNDPDGNSRANRQHLIDEFMSHAGDWEDLGDETAEDFGAEIKVRCAQASTLALLAGSWEGELARDPQGTYEQRQELE